MPSMLIGSRRHAVWLHLALVLLLLGFAEEARAAEGGTEAVPERGQQADRERLEREGATRRASPADRAAAQALFDQGRELMAHGEPDQACPRFEESQRLDSGLGTQFNLAECYEAVGKLASAHTLYLEVAAQARATGQTRRERVARARAEEVEPKLPKLVIEVLPDQQLAAIAVERDGTSVGDAQWGLAVPVDPGRHRVSASGPGLAAWSTEVDVPAVPGVVTVRVPTLVPEAEREVSFFDPLSRKIGLAALGVGVVSLGASSVFAIQAYSKNEDSKRAGCSRGTCPDDASLSLRRDARGAGNRATWAMGLGAVGLAAAAVLFWALPEAPERPEPTVDVMPSAKLGGGVVRVSGRF
jgi:hypothetical protein